MSPPFHLNGLTLRSTGAPAHAFLLASVGAARRLPSTFAVTSIGSKRSEIAMAIANATIGQLLIPVDNLEKGVAFYRDVLGLPFLFAAPPQMAFFNCGNVRILVGVVPPGQKAQRRSAIYFRVPDIRGAFASLRDNGVQFLAEPHVVNRTPKSELWLAEFTDPDGNQLALMSEVMIGAA